MIPLEIETHDRHLGFEIVGSASLKPNLAVQPPGGVTLTYQGTLIRKSVGIPEVLKFIVDAAVSIDLGLFAVWLYDKVKNKEVERVIINRRVVTEITAEGIRQVLEEELWR